MRRFRRLNRLYDVLSQVNQAVVRAHSKEDLLSTVCRHVVERGAVDFAWIGWLDPPTGRICTVAHFGSDKGMLNQAQSCAGDKPEGYGQSGQSHPGR